MTLGTCKCSEATPRPVICALKHLGTSIVKKLRVTAGVAPNAPACSSAAGNDVRQPPTSVGIKILDDIGWFIQLTSLLSTLPFLIRFQGRSATRSTSMHQQLTYCPCDW